MRVRPIPFPPSEARQLSSHVELPGTDIPLADYWRNLLCVGLAALVVGMFLLPAGPSFNPGKPYQYLLGIALYLPALIVGFRQPHRWWALLQRPLMPWLIALFAWAGISLLWTNASRPLDESLRLLGILVFLFAWYHAIGSDLRRLRWLLVGSAGVLSGVAVVALILFAIDPPLDKRLVGFGVMANANLMAAALSAGFLWLLPWPTRSHGQRALKWTILIALLTGLSQTYSRGAWVALFAAVIVLLLLRRGHYARVGAGMLALLGVAGFAGNYQMLAERGWSLRPEIFAQARDLFLQHPWTGMGLGARFTIPANGIEQVHTHNLFTQLAVELGLPGVLLWSVIWLALGYRAWRQRAHTIGRIVLGLWVFATVLVQFDLPHLLDSPRPGWLILWFPLAMSLSFPTSSRHAVDEDLAGDPDLQLAAGAAQGAGERRPAVQASGRDPDRG